MYPALQCIPPFMHLWKTFVIYCIFFFKYMYYTTKKSVYWCVQLAGLNPQHWSHEKECYSN